jgi:hypothetical protein
MKGAMPMEPVNGSAGERIGTATVERADEQVGVVGLNEPSPEPFEATIVRLDQSAAEEIFRLARH